MNATAGLVTIRPELLTFSPEQIAALMPWVWALGGLIAAMLAAALLRGASKWPVAIICMVSGVAAALSALLQMARPTQVLFNQMLAVDSFSMLFVALFCGALIVSVLASLKYLDREGLQHPEYYILLLFSAFGMMVMAAAQDLVVVFIALEIMSLATYILVGFRRADRRSNEAAMKYFVLGGAASAVFLYGTALLYGATGSINIVQILGRVQEAQGAMSPLFTLGAALVVFGFLFKVAAVPFHMWMPDVYEGAPIPVTGFMTTGIKAASFAAFIRVFSHLGFGQGLAQAIQENLHDLIWVVAAATMVIGNVIALTQINLKRMLAYSSIAHTGYLLVGMLAAPSSELGYGPVFLYLVSYTIMNLGAFALLAMLCQRADLGTNLHDLAGLSRRNPWMAFGMAVFLFSMAGIPPTAGFAAKYLMLSTAVQAGEIWLTVIAVLCSAISVYYYLRVLVYMYMREPALVGQPVGERSFAASVAVAAMVVLTLQVGLLPSPMMELAREAALKPATPPPVVRGSDRPQDGGQALDGAPVQDQARVGKGAGTA
ncbi:MAG: NADH-quinone oxidoreductase subunit N [Oligoflexia bacterium]